MMMAVGSLILEQRQLCRVRFCRGINELAVDWSSLPNKAMAVVSDTYGKPQRHVGIVSGKVTYYKKAQKHINRRILHNNISGIPLVLGLRTRNSDPHVYVVFWAPIQASSNPSMPEFENRLPG